MKNKNLIYSPVTFILSILSLAYLDLYFISDSTFGKMLDDFFFNLTNKWMWASIDIAYFITMAIPAIFFLLSIYFSIKALKFANVEQSKKQRMGAIIMLTITTGILISMMVTSLYLWLVV